VSKRLRQWGPKFDFGDQRPAIISKDLAFTSTPLPDGSVTLRSPANKAMGHGYRSSISSPLASGVEPRRLVANDRMNVGFRLGRLRFEFV